MKYSSKYYLTIYKQIISNASKIKDKNVDPIESLSYIFDFNYRRFAT